MNVQDDTLGASTLNASASIQELARARVPQLTVLYHPDLARVGERSWLNDPGGGDGVRLSRLWPAFGRPGEADQTPLGDKYVSRTPHRLRLHKNGGVTIDTAEGASALAVDGALRKGTLLLDPQRVERGVVLTLGDRVVLLLHTASPIPRPNTDDDLGLLGGSAALAAVRDQIRRVAQHDVPVLIRGESGTGKELVANAIHHTSPRSSKAFISVNMAALVPTTAAAALFGHTRGAFTGATQASDGFFGAADQGTLFLDEIGDTPSEVQPALLRALENGEVQPLGAGIAVERNVRLITATDADLGAAVHAGRFRLPLLQRLAGYEITLPPLRERKQDIALMLVHFLHEVLGAAARERLHEPGRRMWLPAALVAQATLAPWPGNVRQLKNFAHRMAIDYGHAPHVDARSLAQELAHDEAIDVHPVEALPQERRLLREISDVDVLAALRRHDFKPGSAARELGVSRPSLYALIESSTKIRKAGDLNASEIERQLAAANGDITHAARALEVSARGLQLRMKQLGMSSTRER